jgi:hypothetical protein
MIKQKIYLKKEFLGTSASLGEMTASLITETTAPLNETTAPARKTTKPIFRNKESIFQDNEVIFQIDESPRPDESKIYECLNDLKCSCIYEDNLIFKCLLDILNQVTEMIENEKKYIVSKKNETLDNQKYILNNWVTFRKLFNLPNRLKKNQKFVSQVIKHAINEINEHYQFKLPIQVKTTQKSYLYRDELNLLKETKVTYSEITL